MLSDAEHDGDVHRKCISDTCGNCEDAPMAIMFKIGGWEEGWFVGVATS